MASSSKSVSVWLQTELIVRATVFAALQKGMTILKSNRAPSRSAGPACRSVHRYRSGGDTPTPYTDVYYDDTELGSEARAHARSIREGAVQR